MKISVVIVNFNKRYLLEKCIASLKKAKYPGEAKTIVVDNGSNDGSIQYIANKFKDIKFIKMGFNSGFCKANNVGIDYALKNGAQGVIILNNDTEVDSNFFSEIVKKIDLKKRIGMISPRILLHKYPNIIDASGFLITPDGLGKNLDAGMDSGSGSKEVEVFCPTGAATFYLKEVLEDICLLGEYFDEDYEFCYEELDLGWRARLRGWKCLHAPNAVVYHHKSASYGAYSEFAAYYSNRNIFYNIIKNYPSRAYVLKALFLSFFRYFFLAGGVISRRGVGYKISNNLGNLKMLKVFFKSLKDVLKKFGRMMKKRKNIQGRKKVDEVEISRWFSELGLSFFNSIYKL